MSRFLAAVVTNFDSNILGFQSVGKGGWSGIPAQNPANTILLSMSPSPNLQNHLKTSNRLLNLYTMINLWWVHPNLPKFSKLGLSKLEAITASSTRLHGVVFLHPWLPQSGQACYRSYLRLEVKISFKEGGLLRLLYLHGWYYSPVASSPLL